MTKWNFALVAGIAGAVMASGAAIAADHEVRMVNRGADGGVMVFEPALIHVEPGDTVTYVATDRGHNAEIIAGMAPDGAEGFKGAMSQDVTVTVTEEGVYGVKCLPHYGMGMVGVIVVGDQLDNLEAAAAVQHPGRAGQLMAELLAGIEVQPVQVSEAAE